AAGRSGRTRPVYGVCAADRNSTRKERPMLRDTWLSWLRPARIGRPSRGSCGPRGRRLRPFCEALEDRCVPALGDRLDTISNPSPAIGTGVSFGAVMSLSGSDLLVSARNDSTVASGAGAVFMYNAGNGSLRWTAYDPAPGVAAGDAFGSA